MKEKGWKDIPWGGLILEEGNAEKYKTGDWRIHRPVWDEKKCTHCLLCWVYCPDSSIIVQEGKFKQFDYEHCKGCGICSTQCPTKAIHMVEEAKFASKKGEK